MASKGKSDKVPKYKYKDRKYNYSGLNINMKGFLCSCNNREKECVRESYNVLNKYADELAQVTSYDDQNDESINEGEDISTDLSKEIQSLKEDTKEGKHRFQSVHSGAKNLIFISTSIEDPVGLAHRILSDIYEKGAQQTRFLIRLVPVEITCKAHLKNIEKAFEPLAEKYFKDEARTFSIIFNHRLNDNISRDDIVKLIADKIMSLRTDHKVNLSEANVSVIIEVIKSIALIGVVPDFLKYKKYNLLSFNRTNLEETQEASKCDPV